MNAALPSVPFARLVDAPLNATLPESLDRLAVADAPPSSLDGGVGEAAARRGLSGASMIGLAALAGALAACAVVFAAREFLPPRPYDDPRVTQLSHFTGGLTVQQQTLAQKVRTLETEGVAGTEAADALAARVSGQSGELGLI